MAQSVVIACIEHQKPSTARAHKLAADRAVRSAELVPVVDLRVAHSSGAALFVLPMLVHQLSEQPWGAIFERLLALQAEFLHVVKIPQHLAVALLRARVLILQDAARASRESGEKKQQVVLQ